MSTNTRPELKFFLYSDPAEAKTADNKRLVRVHVARNSHAKTRSARTRASRGEQADCLRSRSHEPIRQVVSRTSSPSLPSTTPTSPDLSSDLDLETSLSRPFNWLPSGAQAQSLVQGLSSLEQSLLDHYVTVQIPTWQSRYEYPNNPMDLPRFRHGMRTHWVNFCLTDAGLLQGMLLASSQHFANLYHEAGNPKEAKAYEQQALHHRGQLLRAMSDSMPRDTRDVTDYTVAKGMFLAYNEVCL
ncbi:hypothetical protein J7T55_015377 [Diaporthe amygdali]|uniref:uncharacterized protein n=1 Tax=Phomopsis amygdali TaxID=1214568 RepID=UPI0022FDE67A|nr:uncharacterized protein J7T55_015377 [Diaporthe amygdali]KAJ0120646.1 hypothetical protein J7T55_015377 [Diaporthe amygdali]